MTAHQLTLLCVCVAYFLVVLAIGAAAYRRTGRSAEDYFLGSRTARTVVLFMALFGTNVTPFVLMGIPGLAYHHGVGVFGYNAAIIALGIPVSFYLIGYRAWVAARELKAITPAELYARRLGSDTLGLVLFGAYLVYTLPYVVTSVLGVGLAVSTFTENAVSFEVAAAAILAITLVYTALGGMRATMWTNVFQGATFMVVVVVAFLMVAHGMGGVSEATRAVMSEHPELLSKGDRPIFSPGSWTSWALAISLTVIAFPHMMVRIFAARDAVALRNTCRLYPVALVLLWLPAVMLGVWGAAALPGLEGRASDRIFPLMIGAHCGSVVQALALAGILAAVMSTIDAQFLTLSSMLSRDVIRRFRPDLSEAREVRWGRGFVLVFAVVTYALVVARPASIFSIATFSFSGYVMLVPTLYLGLAWRRFTAAGALWSIAAGNVVLLVFMFGGFEPPGDVQPVAWGLAAAIAGAIGGSMASPMSRQGRTRAARTAASEVRCTRSSIPS